MPPRDVPSENGGGPATQPHQADRQHVTETQNKPPKKTRANMTLATLNMNGRASHTLGPNPISKWTLINQLMREQRIDILCLQETHLTQEHQDQINNLFARRLLVLNSSDPDRPGCSAGVAFVLNKEKLDITTAKMNVLIPGRAISQSLNWHLNKNIRIANIYAPNNMTEHPPFWENVQHKWTSQHRLLPDLMMGDFNLTEDPIDRAPMRNDNENATQALRDMRHQMNIIDTWRHTFPTERLFSFNSNNNSMSRIDRIYASPTLKHSLSNWKAYKSIVPTDHKLIQVKYAPPGSPHLGTGRWAWPLGMLNNDDLQNKLVKLGITAQRNIERITNRTETSNPQIIWKKLKEDLTKEVKDATSKHLAKITSRIRTLQKDIRNTTNQNDIDASEDRRMNAIILEKELDHLTKKKHQYAHLKAKATWDTKGETISKYWSKINSPKRPRDIIYKLRSPDSHRPTSKSEEMAEIARNYHERLQELGINIHATEEERLASVRETLNEIPASQTLQTQQINDLSLPVTEKTIKNALFASKAGSSPGLDGIPYEAWRILHMKYNKAVKQKEPSFNIIKTLTMVFNDIQIHGTTKNTNFSLGWMCPIYKKKEREDIGNYRPITLLNTDYKTLTKALATQLAQHIHKLIHPDQSGFIPKRSIFNPIRTTQLIAAYADTMEEEGVIVALDQEKAYDKIRHDYLFETLRKFNLPNLFIKTVESLYSDAFTQVAINGFLSTPYQVNRGVRQGDPLSCLLFNLAIEPLACKLRNSPRLNGYNIPGIENKLIINLYADDATVYLKKGDSYDTLQEILQTWCDTSGAKFNLEKTEILPIGTDLARQRILTNRKLNENDTPWSQQIKIAADGHPIRTLGAWIGNKIDNAATWEPTLDKISKRLDQWKLGNPSLSGKRLIIQMIVGGMTQFLTKAQGMPKNIETAINKIIRNFIWDDSTPKMDLKRLYTLQELGGMNLLDIASRNQAIEITWLSSYMSLRDSRPSWAYIADALINTLQPKGINSNNDINIFLTKWAPPTQGPRTTTLPNTLISLLKTAKKHNMSFAPIQLSRGLKEQLPAWLSTSGNAQPSIQQHQEQMPANHT